MGRSKPRKPHRPRPNDRLARAKVAYDAAVELAFMGEHAADELTNDEWLELMRRVVACYDCGRFELDGEDVSRASLAGLAQTHGWLTARGLLLACIDYAHRMGGCAHQATVIHEIADAPKPAGEPAGLSELLARLLRTHVGTSCNAVMAAFALTEGAENPA